MLSEIQNTALEKIYLRNVATTYFSHLTPLLRKLLLLALADIQSSYKSLERSYKASRSSGRLSTRKPGRSLSSSLNAKTVFYQFFGTKTASHRNSWIYQSRKDIGEKFSFPHGLGELFIRKRNGETFFDVTFSREVWGGFLPVNYKVGQYFEIPVGALLRVDRKTTKRLSYAFMLALWTCRYRQSGVWAITRKEFERVFIKKSQYQTVSGEFSLGIFNRTLGGNLERVKRVFGFEELSFRFFRNKKFKSLAVYLKHSVALVCALAGKHVKTVSERLKSLSNRLAALGLREGELRWIMDNSVLKELNRTLWGIEKALITKELFTQNAVRDYALKMIERRGCRIYKNPVLEFAN